VEVLLRTVPIFCNKVTDVIANLLISVTCKEQNIVIPVETCICLNMISTSLWRSLYQACKPAMIVECIV